MFVTNVNQLYLKQHIIIFIIFVLVEHSVTVQGIPIKIHDHEPQSFLESNKNFKNITYGISANTTVNKNNSTKITINRLDDLKNMEDKLHKFGLISITLYLNNNTQQLRQTRSIPRDSTNICKISNQKLSNLKDEINNALQSATKTPSSNNCELKNNSISCNELIQYVECGINLLKNEFIIATAKGSTSDEFIAWKTSFEALSAAYVKLSDSMERTTEQMYKNEIENLKTTIQLLLHVITILENNPCEVNVIIET